MTNECKAVFTHSNFRKLVYSSALNMHWCIYTRSVKLASLLHSCKHTKWLINWLDISALRKKLRQHQLPLHPLQIILILFPTVHVWLLPVFTYWKQSKTGKCEGLGTMLLQIRPVLTVYLLIKLLLCNCTNREPAQLPFCIHTHCVHS